MPLGSQQDFLLFLEDLLQLVTGPAHGPLHAGHHGSLGLLLLVSKHGRQLRHLVEEFPCQLHGAFDVAFPELLADLVHHRAHVGERHVAQVLRVDELVRNLLGELHERGLQLLELPGELGQFLEHLVQLLVAAAQLVQRIQEALLILDHVPGVGRHVLAREAPAYVLAEHGQPFQLRGHGVVSLFPFRRRFRLAHPFHEFFTGVLEVPSQGLEVGPGGEVADAVLAGAPHGFVHALQHLLEALPQAFARIADGLVVRRGFQVIAQEVYHLVGNVPDHLGYLAMLGLEVLEAEAQGRDFTSLGPEMVSLSSTSRW